MSGWTDDRVERLKKLWLEGLSASQVAKQLGSVTRNAVISKLHRLGLSGRAMPSRPHRVSKVPGKVNAHRPTIVKTPDEKISKPLPPEKRVPMEARFPIIYGACAAVHALHDETERCGFPIGDPRQPDYHYCTGTRAPAPGENAPRPRYCPAHQKLSRQPLQHRLDRAARAAGGRSA
ncbi:GcrA family cell cycle regulator [Parvibaculum sp.]|uniref:GcrA family cell cycle regulator n=1 Tax=Parvibaculum sp. TaxID=2024848 RepID=UPI001D5E7E13|nr:GcrA family cell cycle regulator [Parvibaculum sp.]MBX3490877.1 GcrA cell cycle regulator [Parvibaculum sp.]